MTKNEYLNHITKLYIKWKDGIMAGFRTYPKEDVEDAYNEAFTKLIAKEPSDKILTYTFIYLWYEVRLYLYLLRHKRTTDNSYVEREQVLSIWDSEKVVQDLAAMQQSSVQSFREEMKLLLRCIPEDYKFKGPTGTIIIKPRRFLLDFIDTLNLNETSKRMGLSRKAGKDVLHFILCSLGWEDKYMKHKLQGKSKPKKKEEIIYETSSYNSKGD